MNEWINTPTHTRCAALKIMIYKRNDNQHRMHMTQHIVFENGDSILEKMSHKKLFDAGRKKNVCNTYILLKHAKTFIDPLHNLYTPKEKLKKKWRTNESENSILDTGLIETGQLIYGN